jgi:hypothetical protein
MTGARSKSTLISGDADFIMFKTAGQRAKTQRGCEAKTRDFNYKNAGCAC